MLDKQIKTYEDTIKQIMSEQHSGECATRALAMVEVYQLVIEDLKVLREKQIRVIDENIRSMKNMKFLKDGFEGNQ